MTAPSYPGPLHGVRVLEMEAIGPLLHAGMMLADLGADIVRILRPRRGDLPDDGVTDADAAMLRGRVDVTVDLADPDGAERFRGLVSRADILVEGFRPGTMEKRGFGPSDCAALNPRLIYGRMTGWGQSGPMAHTAGHDLNYLAESGALEPIGPADAPPLPPLNYVGNFGGGSMFLVVGLLAALHDRTRTGLGQVVDAAMIDGASSLTSLVRSWRHAGRWTDERGTNLLDGSAPFYRAYACRDGRFVAVGALEDVFYDRFVDGLGLDPADLPDRWDRAHWPDLTATFADVLATRGRDAWAEAFRGLDACLSPVLSLDEATSTEHARHRDAFVASGPVTMPAPAPRLARAADAAPPLMHDDADAVIARWV